MLHWRGPDDVPADWGRSVVAVGVFDGVHRGHQAVLAAAAGRAAAEGLPMVVVAFDPHPDAVLRGAAPAVLTPPERRDALLAAHGADAVCVLDFTPGFAATPAEDFVRQVLVDLLHAEAAVVGADFRFGAAAAGDVGLLRTLGDKAGLAVDAVPLVADGPAATAVSATLIRERVAAGDVEAAAALLGRPHRVGGVVVRGFARGRDLLGFPTANLDLPPGLAVPADGVYAGRLLHTGPAPGAEDQWPCAISVGTNPTFDGPDRTVEAYALDRDDLELYGAPMAVDFVRRIRGQERFDSVEELITAMDRDVATARRMLAGGSPG
ncbi:riboflavin kinase/FMN adenylyltransferase [Murinocardiopsis flavida]|uniref:Riboflavin biosynthesis protein n=1 Tax=Murinocardiopsis flavida TaxID=645275 RepID=A0A2P8DUZ4_9ACTN|nr:bifunctional riboflavin kinase/FAD synthetase [Murinocardiopsis flavida]PSL01048.1 riboflavin kinase/FMN adenylyltransferase [Murinocardiopsis flavida]